MDYVVASRHMNPYTLGGNFVHLMHLPQRNKAGKHRADRAQGAQRRARTKRRQFKFRVKVVRTYRKLLKQHKLYPYSIQYTRNERA